MKLKFFIFILFLCLFVGVIFYLVQRNWLIIQFTGVPLAKTIATAQSPASRKPIQLFYWKKGAWHHDETTIVWNEQNPADSIQQLVKQWLITMADEELVPHNCSLESVALSSPGSEAYVSFNRSFLLPELSIIKKWYIIEGLFKTIHRAGISLHSMMFLVHDQPMVDEHIEFSQPIPAQERLK